MISPLHHHSTSRRAQHGFSLVELLTSITIMAILLSVGASMLRNPTAAHQVPAAVANSTAAFSAARALAITKNARTMVLINNDTKDAANYRRQIVIVESSKDALGKEVWVANQNPLVLPQGTFVDGDRSLDPAGNPPVAVQLAYPGGMALGTGTAWLSYSFAANGASEAPGARFVIGTGVFDAKSQQFVARRDQEAGGFVLRRVGAVTVFRDATQI